jgi:phenylacetic acid degradation protein
MANRDGQFMVKVYAIDGVVPVVDASTYVHPTAVLIGDVVIGSDCYIGPGASLRGDMCRILVGDGSNIQDNCVVHGFPNGGDAILEGRGHIGHGAVLHACTIGHDAMVGMNAVVMDGARIGACAFVGAMAFVKAGFEVPDRHLAAGVPAKVMRELSDQEIAWKSKGTDEYQHIALRSLETMAVVEALSEEEADRPTLASSDRQPLYKEKEGAR